VTRLAESVAVAAGGAVVGAAVGWPIGLTVPLAGIAAGNGAISGWRGVYEWNRSRGVVAFLLDSSWGLITTAAGLASHGLGYIRREPRYSPELSVRQNRHVYERGFQPRKGFATTLGNVVAGAGDMTSARRRRLVTDHEDVHVWQARYFGPLYPVAYLLWMAGGAVVAPFIWVKRRRRDRLGRMVESCSYYCNPFEWWAYSRDDNWPPSKLAEGFGWPRPLFRPFAQTRAGRR